MDYPKTRYLTKEEILKLKEEDMKRSRQRNFYYSTFDRQNYYASNWKKIQRTLNFHVRQCNKTIENDHLWRSRFFIRQVDYPRFDKFGDGSGGELFVTLRFYDKKTMKYIDSFNSAAHFCFGWGSVYWLMNKAITEYFDVWKSDKNDSNSPEKDNIDYSSIPNDWVVQNATPLNENYNWFSGN